MTDDGEVLGLRDRVAVVTGGGGNIGGATVEMLARVGARVVVADIDGPKAEAVAERARRVGGDAVAVEADTRRVEDVGRAVGAALDRWGRVDVGVNVVGGGVGIGKNALELSDEEWEEGLDTNLYSALRCCRAYASTMIEHGTAGSIVNVASPAALRAAPGMAAYGASKAALINLTWTLAEDVAGAIVAFASSLTSYSTGQMLVCDGGRLLTNPINTGTSAS